MPRISKSDRVELWLDRFHRHSQSGQTIAEFCAAERVSAPSFYQWKRRLAATLSENQETRTVLAKPQQPSFAEVRIVGQTSPTLVSLPGGIHIQLGTDLVVAAIVIDRILQHACPTDGADAATGKSKSC
jgi:hypothetical protein